MEKERDQPAFSSQSENFLGAGAERGAECLSSRTFRESKHQVGALALDDPSLTRCGHTRTGTVTQDGGG